MSDSHFPKGTKVEISIEEDGFRGAWFCGTVLKPPSKNGKVLVQYDTLLADEQTATPLTEEVNLVQIRPTPPRETSWVFKLDDDVDAYHNDGWWEGVVTRVVGNGEYSVYFRPNREQSDFKGEELRVHREWVSGNWVPPSQQEQVVQPVKEKNVEEQIKEENLLIPGSLVEVSSDEEGFKGAWFLATILEVIGEDKYLVEFKDLRTDDDTEFVREEVNSRHIRPRPPPTGKMEEFKINEEVDALYNDGWWVGIISKVHGGSKYSVFFKETDEELEFEHGDLRLRQDWIDGKWVMASKSLKLTS